METLFIGEKFTYISIYITRYKRQPVTTLSWWNITARNELRKDNKNAAWL